MIELAPGESRETPPIYAIEKWNDTGFWLDPAATYTFEVEGNQTWTDKTKPSGPEGYRLWYFIPFNLFRRFPCANWFALIGCLDRRNSSAFRIGRELKGFRPKFAGQLCCYANDLSFMYGNNSGSLVLKVTRIA